MRRALSLSLLILLVPGLISHAQVKQIVTRGDDRIIVKSRKVVIIRRGELVKNFPEKKRAIVTYPVVTGLKDAQVLRRVQSILQVKNVFNSSITEYREDSWLEEFSYEVDFNQNGILDITFNQSGSAAYPDEQSRHFAINLKNGKVLKASDVFVADKLGALALLIDTQLQNELKEIAEENARDVPDYKEIIESQGKLKFEVKNLNDFSVSDKGLTFLYDAGYPHVIKAFEPGGSYFLSYSELTTYLKRDGPLGQFLH